MERQKLRSQDLFTIDIWMLSASQLGLSMSVFVV